jgi:hypothetical protein
VGLCLARAVTGKNAWQCWSVGRVRHGRHSDIRLPDWLAVTFAAYAASSRLADPPDDRLLTSAVAGALWLLLVVGLIELGLLVVCAEVLSGTEPAIGFG